MARVSGFWRKIGTAIEPAFQGGADLLLRGVNRYLNFGEESGESGYGIRDNGGVLQYKNSAGVWTNFNAGGGGGGVTDHGALTGLADDDHTQYHTDARGDARYYTQGQVDTALAGKADTTHSHIIADTTGLQAALDGKAPTSHTHTIANVTGLQTALDAKADTSSLAPVATSGAYADLTGLPDLSVFDEVEQHANLAAFPGTGNVAKFYLAQDTGLLYRWTGSAYAVISAELALGETSTTAYRGDRGKIAFDHTSLTNNPHSVTKAQVGLGSVPDLDTTTAVAQAHVAATVLDSTSIDMIISGQQISAQREALTGDITAPKNSNTTTLATVNSNVGSFGLAGSVAQFTVNAKGLITAAANVAISITASAVTDFAATVRATVLTGLSTATSTAVTATDSILVAIGKLQAQNTAQDTAIALNTAKVTNQNHGGDMSGATTLTAQPAIITGKPSATVAPGDLILIADVNDSNNLKQVTAQAIADLGGGGGGGGGATTVNVAQTGHGLSAGNLIRSNGTNSQYAVADKDVAAQADVVGYVTAVADANNFTYQPLGHYVTNNVPAVAAGTALFVGDNGALTATKPDAIGQFQKPVGIVVHNATAMVMFNMRGMEVTAEDAGGGAGISSTDEAIARFDGTAGALQDSTVRITDNGSIILPENSSPTPASAGELKVFAREISGRILPAFVGPSGLDSTLQPLLARNKVGYWCPPGNATTVPGVLGFTAPTITGFTATARNIATTNMFTRMRRLGYQTAATAGTVGNWRQPANQYTLGTGTGLGGYTYVVRFGISDPVVVNDARMFMGMRVSATPANVEPSTLTNCIGVGHGAADTNLFIYYGGSVAQTPIDLGANFPVRTTSVDVYELALFSSPNTANTINWTVTRLNTGDVATGTITGASAVIPQSSTLTTIWGYRTNNATAAAVGLDVMSAYIETDQ